MVTLFVGPDRTRFDVHQKLLCGGHDDFFAAIMRGNFKEAQTKQINLPEDDAETFTTLLDYIYRNKIPTIDCFCPTPKCQDLNETKIYQLCDLYTTAEKYCMEELMDITIDSIISGLMLLRGRLVTVHVVDIYQRTHEHSKLRELCAGLLCWATLKGTFNTSKDELMTLSDQSPDIFGDALNFQESYGSLMAKGLAIPDVRNVFDTPDWDACNLHVHGPKKMCYLQKGSRPLQQALKEEGQGGLTRSRAYSDILAAELRAELHG